MRKAAMIVTLFALVVGAAPAPLTAAPSKAYTFAVMGDNRSGDRVYSKILAEVMRRGPAFAINVGDVIPNPGNRSQWANFHQLSAVLTMPYYLVPGNHDIDDRKSLEVWREEVDLPGNETFYSFTRGRDLFVVLNSCDPENERRIAGKQLAWLEKTLDPKRYDHQFVFLHHPPYLWKGATHEGEALDEHPAERDALHRLFTDKRVTAVFAGHEHTYRRMERDGVLYVVTGGAGSPLYGRKGPGAFNHFVFLTVDGKNVRGQVIDRDGVLRDEFLLQAP